MKKLVLVVLALLAVPSEAGLFKDSVDLADLAEVPLEQLQELRESEFQTFVAQVELTAARAAEKRAAGAIKAAERVLETENLDLKAARAEAKAARANRDSARLASAEAVLTAADLDQRTAKRFLEWKKEELQVRQAEVKRAATGLDLAEARRDFARVELLATSAAPAAAKYDVSELAKTVRKRHVDHDVAARKAEARAAELERLRQDWLRLSQAGGGAADESGPVGAGGR